ncbi:hypothetical protein SE17_15455 [Kouleothrix aurantiaca]|uniref:Uncharacterized protein n=1 Tax=Kouleothrix aurantiaca TaxID=186479 RepID=A0A0P9DA23_9CHLR|nr:hypothetical protein SE17_15455 [Kouleothrix aurantiaca]
MSEQEREGGVAWEAREALKSVRVAREMGNSEDEYIGWLRYAEAVTNASYSGAASAFIGILSQRETDLAALLTKLGGERKAESAAVLAGIAEIKAGLEETARGLGKQIGILAGRVDSVEEALDDTVTRVAALEERMSRSDARHDTTEKRLDIVEAIIERTGATKADTELLRQLRAQRGL